jgi:hypothetical protein
MNTVFTILIGLVAVYLFLEIGTFAYLVFSPKARYRLQQGLRNFIGLNDSDGPSLRTDAAIAKLLIRTKGIRRHQKAEAELVKQVTGRTIARPALIDRTRTGF